MDEIIIMCDGVQISNEDGRIKLNILGADLEEILSNYNKKEYERYFEMNGFTETPMHMPDCFFK